MSSPVALDRLLNEHFLSNTPDPSALVEDHSGRSAASMTRGLGMERHSGPWLHRERE